MVTPLFDYSEFSLHFLVVKLLGLLLWLEPALSPGLSPMLLGSKPALGLALASPSCYSHTLCALLILIVPIGRNDIYMHLGVEDFINEAVLLRNTAAPLSCTVAR